MRQFSKTSSGNERGLHVQIMKKLDDLNLKSPKAQKNMNWMGLVDDALGIDDLDDDQPYNPQGLKDINKGMDKLNFDDQKPAKLKVLSE